MISLSSSVILPGSTIGIIGGGQLGRMMAIEARHMGYKIAVLDPTPNCPCGQIADIEITAPYNDLEAIKQLAKVSDVITYEFENIDYEALKWLEENAYLPQKSKLLLLTQDRETEKAAIREAGCEVAPYQIVHNEQELLQAIEELSIPAVLKTCRGGYDGKGQVVLKTSEDVEAAKKLLDHGTCILEKWVPFEKEISVIVTRSVSGETSVLPVAENVHKENILYQSIVPARITLAVYEEAQRQALRIANYFGLVGTLAVEMFLTNDGYIYINELAPRPHNSGHYSMDLCETDQFEQHVRAICNLPLGRTTLLQKGIMVNLLGEDLHILDERLSLFNAAKLYLYGKGEPLPKRKIGHVNFLTEANEKLLNEIDSIWNINGRR
ncbi:5-(carboxyamino)imidazole ribonucleotide synthase [Metabacillus fastidiosus]|uniref:N5-carboxyaminoimidazole ribonucleotide synthase n=1 Tax=Metabacillus fastidiosus TaxID=1458 RepID=A0ABU6NYA6_9BACI|nr:5-(carboxyamino)imidazole ribonucleotide synthase [Metabacillus fastidiosus]MED4402031.1 5-(carboxyamino)imidazole ribonucleotide synthase [Metabacillus fastidiosus]MED4460837.1 5-(carboxyamino)imidazole ribonucleotide synthase [Metabacillus fastidiosus]